MEYALIALVIALVLAGAYALFFRRGETNRQLEGERSQSLPGEGTGRSLPPPSIPKREGPSLAERLEAKRTELAHPSAGVSPNQPPEAAPLVPSGAAVAVFDTPQGTTGASTTESLAAGEITSPLPAGKAPGRITVRPSATPALRDMEGLRRGLAKTRSSEGLFGRLTSLLQGKKEFDPTLVSEIEEVLVTSDVGVKSTERLLARIREGLSKQELSEPSKVWDALRAEATRILHLGPGGLALSTTPTVVMMVGVNGAGKTTTIGKLATKFKAEQHNVVLAAGDTFRAAAVQQLEVWGKRVGCEVVRGKEGADPGAVAFDAVQKAKQDSAEMVLVDTAGRLHTKSPLMEELKKIARTLGKAMDGAPQEIWLVLDATNGQNALAQAKQFREALPLTGIVLTKLDGTAKGGVILSICEEIQVPVRYVGLGERADDLHEFHADEFVQALFGDVGKSQNAA